MPKIIKYGLKSAEESVKDFESTMVDVMMQCTGLPRSECIRRRQHSAKEVIDSRLQESLAENAP